MSQGCDHDHAGGAKFSAAELAQTLDAVETECRKAGERLTAARRRVLELLLKAGQPVKAYDLIAGFGQAGEAAKPPTVYRALEFLERQGLAHRIASMQAYVACRHSETAHAAAFLICDCCGATEEIATGPLDQIAEPARQAGYRLSRTTIEAHGLCRACG